MKKKQLRRAVKSAAAAVRQASEEVYVLSKHRIKFAKSGMAKYISHLDLLRCFTRSIMRAGLPVKYSQGFNPHQKITFALPLSIGVTSECETVDIDFEDGTSHEEIKELLGKNLPPDISVIDVYNIKKSANDIVSAKYHVSLFTDEELECEKLCVFFNQAEVSIIKKTKKKGETEVNLMDFVKGYNLAETQNKPTVDGFKTEFDLTLSAGGQSNLKPEIAINALQNYLAPQCAVTSYDIHRTNIFCRAQSSDVIEEFE